MTALYASDGIDFSLVCDGCGMTVDNLGANLHNWDLAWSLFKRHGWVGTPSTGGPHGCPRCTRQALSSADR